MFLNRKPRGKHATPADGTQAAQPPDDAAQPSATPAAAQAQDGAQTAHEEPAAELSPADIARIKARADEADELHTKHLYALAELENFRKRTAKERRDLINYAGQEILFDLLEILDNFDRALDAGRTESNPAVIIEGINLIRTQLARLTEKFGVKPVEALGAQFDPRMHEALQRLPSADAPPGTVIHEMQKGYMLRDRVLRPARVVVACEPAEPAGTDNVSDVSDE